MRRHLPNENTPRVIAIAVAFFGALAALGWADGVFAKLGTEELAALAAFAAGFAVLTYFADRQVRATVNRAIAGLRGRSARPGRTRGRPVHIQT